MTKVLDWLDRRLGDSSPIWAAFFGSLVLSWVALQGSGTLNNDGITYVEAARGFVTNGYTGLFSTFDWPLLSLMMAGLGNLAGVSFESAGHSINALFLAGMCALMVDLVRQRHPEATWVACLVVLSIPGINGYRDQLLREYGCWFFSVLAFWFAIRWEQAGFRWREALLCQGSLILALLFRFEAALFFPALAFWQLFSAARGERVGRLLKIGFLPIAAGSILVIAYVIGVFAIPARLMEYLHAVDTSDASRLSQQAAKLIESGILPKYSKDEAGYILFFGLLAVVPLKFISTLGVFSIPFFYPFIGRPLREPVDRWMPLVWAFLAHLIALAGFAVYKLFVLARHAGPLALLAVPVVADGILLLLKRFPRWKLAIIAASLLTMAANVITSGPGHLHVREAGLWIEQNIQESDRVFVEDPKVTYRAGWRRTALRVMPMSRQEIEGAVAEGRFDTLVLSQARKKPSIEPWLARNGWTVMRRFENGAGDAVVVVDVKPLAGNQRPP